MNNNYNDNKPSQQTKWEYQQNNPEAQPINYNQVDYQQGNNQQLPHQMNNYANNRQQSYLQTNTQNNPYPSLQPNQYNGDQIQTSLRQDLYYQQPSNQQPQNFTLPPPPINENIGGAWNCVNIQKKQTGVVEDITELAQDQYKKFVQNETVQILHKKMDFVKLGIQQDFDNLDRKFQEALAQQRQKMNVWIRLKVEEIIIKLLQKLRPSLKESLKDPYMCECVKDIIDDVFDEMWPEIEEEVLFQLRIKFFEPYSEKVNIKPELCWAEYPWFWLKSWYLYSNDPCKTFYDDQLVDQSIWYQLRTFSWWIIFLFKLIPFYGIQSFFYFFVFFCIDKRDEFQLVNFILAFKRMQFISIGVIGTLIGYLTFYSCSTVNILTNSEKYDSCRQEGPAIYLNIYADIIGFMLQVVMIWVAWILLPCSKEKGRPKYKYATVLEANKDVKQSDCCCCQCHFDRGGKLKCFLIFDLICFFLCVGLFFALLFAERQMELWQIRAAMFLVKTIYGMLSFPFLIFILPTVTYLLTKSRSTAYDKFGNCVPQVANLTEYHKEKKMRSSMLHKDLQPKEYDERYADRPPQQLNFIEEEPFMDELDNHQP